MKIIWEEKDIESGLYIIKNSSTEGDKNLSFARTVTYKVCYDVVSKNYCLTSVFTDGMILQIGTKKELIDSLNIDDQGYRPLTKRTAVKLLSDTDQGFLF